jgi:hypothetical protein
VIADSLVMEGLGSEVFSIRNSGSTTSRDDSYTLPSLSFFLHWRLAEALHPRGRTIATKPELATLDRLPRQMQQDVAVLVLPCKRAVHTYITCVHNKHPPNYRQ